MQAQGLTYDDLAGVDLVSYNNSVSLLKDGNAEVFTLGTTVPASAIMDLASARDIKLLAGRATTCSPRCRSSTQATSAIEIAAGSYPGPGRGGADHRLRDSS